MLATDAIEELARLQQRALDLRAELAQLESERGPQLRALAAKLARVEKRIFILRQRKLL
jgi:hypothetical protein